MLAALREALFRALFRAQVNPLVTKVGFGVDFQDTKKLATTGIVVSQAGSHTLLASE